jgi:MFS family permease
MSQRRSMWIALLVAVTFFMENLDATVIATALPDMARTFGVPVVDVNIGMSVYMLAVAVFIPISGWLADRFGSRLVFSSAIVLFSLSSLMCALSGSLETFVAARVLQGISGAMMVPVGRLAVLRTTEKKTSCGRYPSLPLCALDAGLLVLAVFAGNLAMKPFTTAVMQRWGFRPVLMVNGVLGVMAIAACALLDEHMSRALILLILFVGGLSRSMQFTAFNTLGFADVPQEKMSDASTLFSMFFQLSMAMGVAVGALLLRLAMTIHSNTGQAATGDFQLTFLCVAAIGAIALLDNLRLPPKAGESVLQRA